MRFAMGFVFIIIGVGLFWLSYWILLHISEQRVQRLFDSWLNQKLAKDQGESEGYLVYAGAMASVVLMYLGLLAMVVGMMLLLM